MVKLNDLVEELIKQLKAIAPKLDTQDMMQVALNLGISLVTVRRYLAGEVKKPALGEKILAECQGVTQLKNA